MARLSQATRQYILTRLLEATFTELEKHHHRLMPVLYRDTLEVSSTRKHWKDNRDSRFQIKGHCNAPIFDSGACGVKDDFIHNRSQARATVPRQFFQDHVDNRTYEVLMEFEACMDRPRTTITYPGEYKALKKAQANYRRRLRAQWDQAQEGASELRRLVLEANKLMAAAEEKVMLAGNGDAEELMQIFTRKLDKALA